MNYYEHHLGDWAAATGHLTWDEDMAYTRLLRAYYHHEKAIPDGQQYRLAKASTPSQRKAVDQVLREFFELRDGHHHQKRADAEIARYQDKQRKAKASADARWSQSGRNANASPIAHANAMRTHSEGNALQTPDTRHQTPEVKNTARKRATPSEVPADVLLEAGFDANTAAEFIAHKSRAKAPLTQRAWADHLREAEKAGWTPQAAAEKVMAKNWRGFEAKYVENERKPGAVVALHAEPAWRIEQRDRMRELLGPFAAKPKTAAEFVDMEDANAPRIAR